jgi:hypothetical protein
MGQMKTPDQSKSVFRKMFSSVIITALLHGTTSAQEISGQGGPQAMPFQPMPDLTVDTNNATYLPDLSQAPTPPAYGPVPQSPATTRDFQGLTDNNIAYPPDTHGAVGTNHVVTMLNTQVRIATRTGTTITTMSLSSFWNSTNIGSFTEVFDPRIVYDPYNNRWIASAAVEPQSSNSGILIGVSRTSSPTNTGDAGWNLQRVKADSTSTKFADFPMLGFNKNWIVVGANMYSNPPSPTVFSRSHFYVFNKTNLYAGNFTSPTLLADTNSSLAGDEFPAVTYDNSLSTLYIMQDFKGNYQSVGWVRKLSITGPVGSPMLNNAGNPVFLVVNTTWNDQEPNNGADFAPQLGLSVKVQNNDARIGNLVYRNGYLWFAQTVFLPAASPTHSAIQWWQLNPTEGLMQFGRIEDTSESQYYYAFPSIAVNRFNDVLIGFSRYSSNQYVSANYAFRAFNDPQNSMQVERAFKAGEDSYWKQDTSGNPYKNRWGDYSATCVDPVNDGDFWTVQEYTTPHVGTVTNLSGRWAVWWGNVTVVVPPNDNFASATVISGSQGSTNGTNIRATKETGEPNHAGNSGGASVWYNWTAPASGSVTIDTIGSTFDTVLAVYTGSSVGSLTTIASDAGSPGNGASRVTFTATSGTTYRIAVDGFNDAMGNLVLNWFQPTAPIFVLQPQSQAIYQGSGVTFTSSAIGTPNPSYQWRFNSANIGGATGSSYTINPISTNNAGNYTVVASNTSGSVTSSVAVLTVLTSQATLSGSMATNNTFKFTIGQVSGLNYIVQANTNLSTTNWVAIATNTAPFTVTDTAFTNNPQRFYRTLYKP